MSETTVPNEPCVREATLFVSALNMYVCDEHLRYLTEAESRTATRRAYLTGKISCEIHRRSPIFRVV